jgi:hypothetical protein
MMVNPDLRDFLKYVMECQGYGQKDLACLLPFGGQELFMMGGLQSGH